MAPLRIRQLGWILFAATLVAGAGFLSHGRLTAWIADRATSLTGTVRGPAQVVRAFIAGVAHVQQLVRDNQQLRDQLASTWHVEALTSQEREEFAFYRGVAGLKDTIGNRASVLAHILATPDSGGVTILMVDRGSDDGVQTGDVVMTASGSLIGLVATPAARHALVRGIADPSTQLAARLLGTSITGLVRTDAKGSMLDLVRRDETVAEGQVVLTSGDDRLPPGLVLGTVRSIDPTTTSLFQSIRIELIAPDTLTGNVLIIHP